MVLQGQNEGLHQSLLKTAVRMECLGEEFISSQKLLEAELQRTRMELSNLTERFKSLHNDCSSTQQTNSLLEKTLHSVSQNMEGERERLHRRISELTEQLSSAKYGNSVEAFNVTSVLHKTNFQFQSDDAEHDAINQVILPIAPPPAQFMDNHSYEKVKQSGQEQPLGSVPEEEESDWSEMGEDIPRFILTGSNRGQVWTHQEEDLEKDESGGEENDDKQVSSHPLQIPHLQFTVHNECNSCYSGFKNLSEDMKDEGSYRITTSPNHGSTILIRSASLEEIPLAGQHMQKELRGTGAMMNLHHTAVEVIGDLDNEIIHHWRTSSDRDVVIGRPTEGGVSEVDGGLQSAERILNHCLCHSPTAEGSEQSTAEFHAWKGEIPDEVLKGERTEL